MIPQNQRLMIKHLLQQGVSKAQIVRETGVCRQTVYNVLNEEEKPQVPRPSILDPFKDYLRKRLETYDLSAQRLFEEIRLQGYTGSYSTVKPFVRALKGAKVTQLTERYETLPGEQAQFDWGECGSLEVNGQTRKLYVFTLVLGYSRMLFALFTTSMNQQTLLSGLEQGFQQLGVPQKLLVDNMKTAVDLHAPGGQVTWNRQFLDFAQHYGFLPIAAPPYWPRIKGKVESNVKFVKRSFLEGRSVSDLSDLNGQLRHWLDTEANVRLHGTTKEAPVVRYQQEKSLLRLAEAIPAYPLQAVEVRKVAWDCHASFEGVRYSVPPEVAGKEVEVRSAQGEVSFWYADQEVARHVQAPAGSPAVSRPEHMLAVRALRKVTGKPTGRQPRFEQVSASVLVPSLTAYDQLLVGGVQ